MSESNKPERGTELPLGELNSEHNSSATTENELHTTHNNNGIDADIDSGRKKHRILVGASMFAIVGGMLLYLAWLLIIRGYAIAIAPVDAKAEASIHRISGTGFILGSSLYTFGGEVLIEAQAPLYKPGQVTVNRNSANNITITLEPLPAELTATSTPSLPESRWLINGNFGVQGEQYVTELPEGEYQLSVSHPYFKDDHATIIAEKGQQLSHHFNLEPVSGELQIDSVPTGAKVHIDGEPAGNTPLILERAGGNYSLTVMAEGFEPVHDVLEVTERQPIESRRYNMQLLGATVTAQLQPANGVLTVNGSPVATNAPFRVNANEALTIRYSKPGYVSATQRMQLEPGAREAVRFNLAAEFGELQITANVQAQVSINGQAQGETPLPQRLQTLPQRIQLQRPYYRSKTVTVTPSANAITRNHVELIPEFDARRQEGRPLFANRIGMQLIPVELDSFTMGSPPGESGRQRNEVQRDVSFSRDIWVSATHVTEAQYARFSGQGNSDSKLPITNISWLDAARFSNWLSEQERLMPFYIIQGNQVTGVRQASRGYRLPSEAEWEFIAKHFRRAARTAYIWGNQAVLRDGQANFADQELRGEQAHVLRDYEDDHKGIAPVASYRADRNGFYDLDGNVREWVHDAYVLPQSGTTISAETDYLGPNNGRGHVIKGASYLTGQMQLLRASVRYQGTEPAVDVGFRIARYHQ